jgi:hypothetical protein
VLADHVHILEGALEEMALIHGQGTGGVVHRIDHLDGQPNRVRRGNAQRRTLVHAERAAGAHRVPDVTHGFRQESPAGAEVGFGVAHVRLDHGLLAVIVQPSLISARLTGS